MVSAEFSKHALEDLEKIDPIIVKRVVDKVLWLKQNFDDLAHERLHHSLRNLYKLRVGDYRVFYSIDGNTVTVVAVRHRREAYD